MTSTTPPPSKIARRTGLAAAVASVAMMVAPATGLASAPVKFGAKLEPDGAAVQLAARPILRPAQPRAQPAR